MSIMKFGRMMGPEARIAIGGGDLSSYIISMNPAGFWKCDDAPQAPTTNDTLADSSGNGCTMNAGLAGHALGQTSIMPTITTTCLNSTANTFVALQSAGTALTLPGAFTLCCFIKSSNATATIRTLMGRERSGDNFVELGLGVSATGTPVFYMNPANSAPGIVSVTGPSTVMDGNLHMLTARYTGTAMNLFVDRTQVATLAYALGHYIDAANTFSICGINYTGAFTKQTFFGLTQYFSAYNSALTDLQISQMCTLGGIP